MMTIRLCCIIALFFCLSPYLSAQNDSVQVSASTSIVNAIDTMPHRQSFEGEFFEAPSKFHYNIDSLIKASIVLEIDTMPKGFGLIANINREGINQPVKYVRSIFYKHQLRSRNILNKPRVAEHYNWFTLVLLVIFLFVGIISMYYRKRVIEIINLVGTFKFNSQILRQDHALQQRATLLLLIVFLLASGLLVCLINREMHIFSIDIPEFFLFSVSILACMLYYVFKLWINSFFGFVFKVKRQSEEYNYHQMLMLQLLGLLIAVLIPLAAYSQMNYHREILIAGAILPALFFVIRMISTLKSVNLRSFSPLYIFLYLCSVEILPIVVVIKLIK